MVNVIVLFPRIDEAKSIKNLLIRNGINVTQVCTTGAQAAHVADMYDDGIIICGYKFQDMLFSDLVDIIPECFEVIVVASKRNYEDCRDSGVVCLTMPLKSQDFISMVSITIDNLLWERKKRKNKPKERNEEEKKIITAAKLKLINEHNYDEQGAHRFLQKKSMDNGVNIIEMSYMILNDTGFF